MNNLELTKIVRREIREHMSYTPFLATNKYEKCRTVKTYASDKSGKLRERVDNALREAGSSDHSIKVLKSTTTYGTPSDSFIVRLPL